MIDRFSGEAGRANLMEALLRQEIVANDNAVAEKLARAGQLVEFKVNETIVEQNGNDTEVYFILSGEANVFVNLRPVATRTAGQVVGEMVATNPSAQLLVATSRNVRILPPGGSLGFRSLINTVSGESVVVTNNHSNKSAIKHVRREIL